MKLHRAHYTSTVTGVRGDSHGHVVGREVGRELHRHDVVLPGGGLGCIARPGRSAYGFNPGADTRAVVVVVEDGVVGGGVTAEHGDVADAAGYHRRYLDAVEHSGCGANEIHGGEGSAAVDGDGHGCVAGTIGSSVNGNHDIRVVRGHRHEIDSIDVVKFDYIPDSCGRQPRRDIRPYAEAGGLHQVSTESGIHGIAVNIVVKDVSTGCEPPYCSTG